MEEKINLFESILELSLVVIFSGLLFIGSGWIFRRIKSGKESVNILRNSILSLIVLVGTLAFVLALPIDKNLKGQIISFLGIILSAAIALSSTTLLGNLIAGIMNNSIGRFKYGDLIQVEDFQGRVTRKSVFHVEIQSEDSNFITMPNLFVASNPVKLTRKSKTIISTTVSLGYDVSRSLVEESLKDAALLTGLTDPFVYIIGLGDFSIAYKVHGFLADSDKYYSSSSLLNGNVIDVLHQNKIEIVSPTFMNQRSVDEKTFIPRRESGKQSEPDQISHEEQIFDRAFKSEELEDKTKLLESIKAKKDELNDKLKGLKDEEEIEKIRSTIKKLENSEKRLQQYIKEQNDIKDKDA